MVNKSFFITLFVCFWITSNAQEVILEVAGNRDIESAYRLTKNPKLMDTIIPYSEINYPLLNLQYKSSFQVDTIQVAKFKVLENLPTLYPGYVKVGIGSKFMPLLDVYYASTRSRKYAYSAHLNHLSSWSSLPNYANSTLANTGIGFQGALNQKKYSITSALSYNKNMFHYYGIPDETIRKDSIKQAFDLVKLNIGYIANKRDSLHFNYKANLAYQYFQNLKPIESYLDNWHSKEHQVKLHAKAWYNIRKEVLQADLISSIVSYNYGTFGDTLTQLADSALLTNDILLTLKPNILTYAKDNRLKIKFGASLSLNVHEQNRIKTLKPYIFPDIEIKYSLFNDLFIPFLEVNGGIIQQSYSALALENPFVLSNLVLTNENNVINGKLGIKGTLSKQIIFNAYAQFGIHKNKALFITDTLFSLRNQFNIVYDDMQIAKIQASIIYRIKDKLEIEGIGAFYSYLTTNEIFAWNLPQLEFDLKARYTLSDKWSFGATVHNEAGRWTKVYNPQEKDVEENTQFGKKLGFFSDLNLEANYHYNSKLTGFLNVNNALTQRYLRYYNYPTMGLQVMGGIQFKF